MKCFIDIYHVPQFNFFRNTILNLKKKEVDLCCIDRGKLVSIIQNDCPGYNLIVLGNYKRNKGRFSMLFRIIIPRIFSLLKIILKGKYNFILTAHYQSNFAAWLLGIPNIAFIDDPRKIAFDIDRFSTNELYVPCFEKKIPKTKTFNALKEWSYLSPDYFRPQIKALEEYDLSPGKYLFIREVDTKTSNYLGQAEDNILSISDKLKWNGKIVLSLEKKANRAKYPKEWIILDEPVKDIHSLMYYSTIVISSGDSMAREGAMLGVPSIYCGYRDMPANQVLIKKEILFKVTPENVPEKINLIVNRKIPIPTQDTIRKTLLDEWEDINKLILNKISFYCSKLSNT